MRTKLIETLTSADIQALTESRVVGLFLHLGDGDEDWNSLLPEMCNQYYLGHSANKPISTLYQNLLTLKEQGMFLDNVAEHISKIISAKFLSKWNKVYASLVMDYNPLETHDLTVTKKGDNSDTTTYDTKVDRDTSVSSKETTTTTNNSDNRLYGFNETENPVGDTFSEDTTEETREGLAEDNQSTTSEEKTGTDTKDYSIDETTRHMGREGIGADMLKKELALREKYNFFDIVFKDIDSVVTLPIYI